MPESPSVAARPGRARWGLAACVGLALVAYRELLRFQHERALPQELEQWFFVPSASLSPLVVLMSLWLLYRRRERLRALPASADSPGPAALLLLAGLAVYAWATYTGATDLLVPSLMLNGLACARLWKGARGMRVVALPVAFLVLAMPLPAPLLNELMWRLQLGTAELSGWILYVLGLPHLVAGDRIVRPDYTFSIIESCSGLRSMQILSIVAILMMDLFRRRGLHAWLVVLAAPPIAFGLNAVRSVLLILNPHSDVAAIHNLQGIAILLTGLLALFLLDTLLERLAPAAPPPSTPPSAAAAPPAAGRWSLALAALGLAAAASLWLPRWSPPPAAPLEIERLVKGLPASEPLGIDRRFLGSAGFHSIFLRSFPRRGEGDLVVFAGLGERANRGHSPLTPKTAVPGSGWLLEEEGTTRLEPDGQLVRTRVLRSGTRRVLSFDWREGTQGWWSELLRSALALDRSPWRLRQEILALRVEAPLALDRAGAEAEIRSLVGQLRPLLRPGASTSQGFDISGGLLATTHRAEACAENFFLFFHNRKRFSPSPASAVDPHSCKINHLAPFRGSAQDLLSPVVGAMEPPGGSKPGLTAPWSERDG